MYIQCLLVVSFNKTCIVVQKIFSKQSNLDTDKNITCLPFFFGRWYACQRTVGVFGDLFSSFCAEGTKVWLLLTHLYPRNTQSSAADCTCHKHDKLTLVVCVFPAAAGINRLVRWMSMYVTCFTCLRWMRSSLLFGRIYPHASVLHWPSESPEPHKSGRISMCLLSAWLD